MISNRKFRFSNLPENDFLQKAECIVKCMDSAEFPPHMPKTAEIKTAIEAFKFCIENNFSSYEKNTKRIDLENLLMRLPAFCASSAIDEMVSVCGISAMAN